MTAPWPGQLASGRREAGGDLAAFADPAAEAEIGALMQLVTEVRRFRSDQGLRPTQPVPAALTGIGGTPLAGHEAAIRALLRLTAPGEAFAPTASVQACGVTVELDTAATIDVAAERRRLEKDLAAAQADAAATSGSWPRRRSWSGPRPRWWPRAGTGWPPRRPRSPGSPAGWRAAQPAGKPASQYVTPTSGGHRLIAERCVRQRTGGPQTAGSRLPSVIAATCTAP